MAKEVKFKEVFKKELKKRKITRQMFADELHYGIEQVNNWARGKSVPKTYDLVILADYFDMSLDMLVTGEGYDL